jgi:hypothetical protein
VGADDARIRAAVEATVDAGTVRFEMELETEPADVNRSRSHGVCDFTQRRAECRTVTDVPANVPDTFQITDGGVVYTQEPGGHWHALDMGGWAAASLMSDLGWFYGVVEARELAPSEHTVTTSARHAVDACPAPLRDELRTAFEQSGHLDAIATGWVRTDASNRITGCRLSIPPGGAGLFGPVDLTCRIALDLSRFGEPAAIRVPDAGPAQPVREGIAQHFGRVDGPQ